MLDINLEYYRHFYYTAKLQSFTKAAEALFVSQSAVSQAIGKLEKQLGHQLLIRNRGKVELTDMGRALYNRVEAAFEELSAGEQEFLEIGKGYKGNLRIKAFYTQFMFQLLPTLHEFMDLYPNINVSIGDTIGNTEEIIADMIGGTADIGMGVYETMIKNSHLDVYKGMKIEMAVICRGEDHIGENGPLSPKELLDYPIISLGSGKISRDIIQFFEKNDVDFKPAISVLSSMSAVALVKEGFGLGIIQKQLVKEDIAAGKIREVPLTKEITSYHMGVACSKDVMTSAMAQVYINFLLEKGVIE